MAYTTPKTWTISTLLTAADLNTYVRDNIAFLAMTPKVSVRLTSQQSVPDATSTTISWHEAVWETDASMWDIASPTKIIIPRAGLYDIDIHTLYAMSAAPTDEREISIVVNTSETRVNKTERACTTHAGELQLLSSNFAVNDEIEIQVKQSVGAALALEPTRTRLVVAWSSIQPT